MRGWAWIAAGAVAVSLAVMAWSMTTSHQPPRDAPSSIPEPDASRTSDPEPRGVPRRSNDSPSASRPAPPRGLRLGDGSKPGARSNAQAIADAALEELQRYDEVDVAVAREIYMRGHAALERVEDELDDDDEPGRAKLRADSEALRAQMERLFNEP